MKFTKFGKLICANYFQLGCWGGDQGGSWAGLLSLEVSVPFLILNPCYVHV